MKDAKVKRIAAYEVTCPNCFTQVENFNDGSMIWFGSELKEAVPKGKTKGETTCQTCGVTVRFVIPKGA